MVVETPSHILVIVAKLVHVFEGNAPMTACNNFSLFLVLNMIPPGMFLAHSTALKRILAANSQMLSMPIMLLEAI